MVNDPLLICALIHGQQQDMAYLNKNLQGKKRLTVHSRTLPPYFGKKKVVAMNQSQSCNHSDEIAFEDPYCDRTSKTGQDL